MEIPHAWKQDVSIEWEGPATYRARVQLPAEPRRLLFHGVSYACRVWAGDRLLGEHLGIWDAFSFDLAGLEGQEVEIRVEVTKNGGATYPVPAVLSGFLPYVFGTFGGIYKPVEIVAPEDDWTLQSPEAPGGIRVEGSKIWVGDRPFYGRGTLTWGWYPDLGHMDPSEDTIRREIAVAQDLGFNLIKFCLWLPPHRYLELMHEAGLMAWLELPLWMPDPERLAALEGEFERIVLQYRRHPNVLAWTVGCELGASTPAEFREKMVNRLRELTKSPLIKDDSGGAEMYGGDPREFGDFQDFHPYCDTPFYPVVLDSLLPGTRPSRPILLGEFNDYDVYREYPRLKRERPYWGSPDPALNAQGVRWQHDLPRILDELDPGLPHGDLLESSRSQALFIRKTVQEAVRERAAIGGYVITGWRDTPISSAGMLDDWDQPRFTRDETAPWNGRDALFLIRQRRPPWWRGGNRPGWQDACNRFAGQNLFLIGAHSESGAQDRLTWRLERDGVAVAQGAEAEERVAPLESRQIAEIALELEPGEYVLHVGFGLAHNVWPIFVTPKPSKDEFAAWQVDDPEATFGLEWKGLGPSLLASRVPADLDSRLNAGGTVVVSEPLGATKPMPFWREACYRWTEDALGLRDRWSRLLAISGDRALDPAWVATEWPQAEVICERVDTRTLARHPVVLRVRRGSGCLWITTLRPQGGLGAQPNGLMNNPAGIELLRACTLNPAPRP